MNFVRRIWLLIVACRENKFLNSDCIFVFRSMFIFDIDFEPALVLLLRSTTCVSSNLSRLIISAPSNGVLLTSLGVISNRVFLRVQLYLEYPSLFYWVTISVLEHVSNFFFPCVLIWVEDLFRPFF